MSATPPISGSSGQDSSAAQKSSASTSSTTKVQGRGFFYRPHSQSFLDKFISLFKRSTTASTADSGAVRAQSTHVGSCPPNTKSTTWQKICAWFNKRSITNVEKKQIKEAFDGQNVDIGMLFKTMRGKQAIEEYAKEEFCQENFNFLKDSDEYDELVENKAPFGEIFAKYKEIVEKYIQVNAEQQINLPDIKRKVFEKEFESFKKEFESFERENSIFSEGKTRKFDIAQNEIRTMINAPFAMSAACLQLKQDCSIT